MPVPHPNYSLELLDVHKGPIEDGVEHLTLRTDDGDISCRLHPAEGDTAVLWVGGAEGGLNGPARGIYTRLAGRLVADRIASLRLHYRRPNHLMDCALDVLIGVAYLEAHGYGRIILVGHSFGGAVVITAGAASENVIAVVPMSSQTYGTSTVGNLSPRPLLLIHGSADEVLPDDCSKDLYRRANPPKEILLYPGCRHGLDECREEVDRDLLAWIRRVSAGEAISAES